MAFFQAVLDGGTLAVRGFLSYPFGFVIALGEVLRVDVGDVEEAVELGAEVDEGGLDGGFDIGDASDIDIVDAGDFVGVFGEDIFELTVFEDGDAAVFAWDIVDDHLGARARGVLL